MEGARNLSTWKLFGVGILLSAAVVLLLAGGASATISGTPYTSGDWDITVATSLTDQSLVVDGDINIYSTLTVSNATIEFAADGLTLSVLAPSGGLTLGPGTGETLITTQDSAELFYFIVQSTSGTVSIQNVTIERVNGGIEMTGGTSANRIVAHTTIVDAAVYGVHLINSGAIVHTIDVTVAFGDPVVTVTNQNRQDYSSNQSTTNGDYVYWYFYLYQYRDAVFNAIGVGVEGGTPWVDGIDVHMSSEYFADPLMMMGQYKYQYRYDYYDCLGEPWYYWYHFEYTYDYVQAYTNLIGIDSANIGAGGFLGDVTMPSEDITMTVGIDMRDDQYDYSYRYYYSGCSASISETQNNYNAYSYNYLYWDSASVTAKHVKGTGSASLSGFNIQMGNIGAVQASIDTSAWSAPSSYHSYWRSSTYSRMPNLIDIFALWIETEVISSNPGATMPASVSVSNGVIVGAGVRVDVILENRGATRTTFQGTVTVDNVNVSGTAGTGLAINVLGTATLTDPDFDYSVRLVNSSFVGAPVTIKIPNTEFDSDYRADVLVENNRFEDVTIFQQSTPTYQYVNPDPCQVLFTSGQYTYSYRYYERDYQGALLLDTGDHCRALLNDVYAVDVVLRDNTFKEIRGPMFGWHYADYEFAGGSNLTFEGNTFMNITYNTAAFTGGDAMVKSVAQNVYYLNNHFENVDVLYGHLGGSSWAYSQNNPAYYGFEMCAMYGAQYPYYNPYAYYGCDYRAKDPTFTIDGNTFINVEQPSTSNREPWIFGISGAGDLSFTNNTITDSKARFVLAQDAAYYYQYPEINININVDNNVIVGQTGEAPFGYYDPQQASGYFGMHDNEFRDSSAPFFDWTWGYYSAQYEDYRADESLAVLDIQRNLFQNLTLGAKPVLTLAGRATMVDNTFDQVVGWAVKVEYVSKLPSIDGNSITDTTNGYWFEPTTSSGSKTTSIFTGLTIAVADTAIKMERGNLILNNMDFTGAQTAVDIRDGFADIYSSKILVLSGHAQGDATITTYNNIGYQARWSNAEGVDSGVPVANALVVTTTPDHRILTSGRTDAAGIIAPRTTEVWKIQSFGTVQVVDLYLPLQVLVSGGGITATNFVPQLAPGEALTYFEDEPALAVFVQDNYIPVVSIGSPLPGSSVGSHTFEIEGYTFERGSGLATQQVRIDGGAWIDVPSAIGATWTVEITIPTEGAHDMEIMAADIAGNVFVGRSTVVVDVTPPVLTLQRPLEAETLTNQPIFAVQGHVEPVTSTVTVNGVRMSVTSRGDFFLNFTLSDGLNVLLVAAQDQAHNEIMLIRTITFDRYAPFLIVDNPVDRLLTFDRSVDVLGRSERDARVTVNGYPAFVNPLDGTFVLPNVALDDLFDQTENLLVIRATDRAGNQAYANRTVVVDTTAPSIDLDLDPVVAERIGRGEAVSVTTLDVRGSTDTLDAQFEIAGQEVPLSGISFSRVIVLSEGVNVIPIRAEDAAGNVRQVDLRVVRDTVRPVLTLESPAGDTVLTNRSTMLITGYTDSEGSLIKVVYTNNRGESVSEIVTTVAVGTPIKYRFEYTLVLNTDGNGHDVEVQAVDSAGNFDSQTFTYTAKVGTPFLELVQFPTRVTDTFLWVNGTTEPGITTVRINGQDYDVVDQFFAVRWNLPITEGNYSITVSVRDDAGNVNTLTNRVEVAVPPPSSTGGDVVSNPVSNEVLIGAAALMLGAAIAVLAFALSRRRTEYE
jgi:hypothetical protein